MTDSNIDSVNQYDIYIITYFECYETWLHVFFVLLNPYSCRKQCFTIIIFTPVANYDKMFDF